MVEAAVLGGAVLGGGGGGAMADGRRHALLAVEMGEPELVTVEELPSDAVLVTASAVGAPAAKTAKDLPVYYVRVVEILARETRVDGLITNECGGLAAVNGWLQAAMLGIPVVDAPCNGRAHPTGVMGSMGLHRVAGYVSRQAAVGGDPAAGTYVEMLVRGNLERAAALVRQASVQAGGMVAVARNPVTVSYARDNAAVGAIRQVLNVGRAMLEARGRGPMAMVEAACEVLGGKVLATGRVADVRLETSGGFDVGRVVVQPSEGAALELDFWNEYAICERRSGQPGEQPGERPGEAPSERLATFPDLIATFDLSSGLPLSSAEIATGHEVVVVHVPRQRLILGAGMRDPELMRAVERAVGKDIVKYVFQ
ncbi:MAG TPA: DUF917 family protein [Firmicutes bacterium]|nr:DUF917 family protein [Bacillota bacterium]